VDEFGIKIHAAISKPDWILKTAKNFKFVIIGLLLMDVLMIFGAVVYCRNRTN